MDQQLKQRLIGATIIVSLVVIFVPMLFDDRQGDQYAGTGDVPALPKEVEVKPVELPKTASEAAPSAGEESENMGYRIIPLTDNDSPNKEDGETAFMGTGTKPETSPNSVAEGVLSTAAEDIAKDASNVQASPGPGFAQSNDAAVVKAEKPAQSAAVGKSKPSSTQAAKLEPPTLKASSQEESVIDVLSPGQPVAPVKMKPKTAPVKAAEKVSKKSDSPKLPESRASVKSASPSAGPQRPASGKSSVEASKVIRPELVSKAPEAVSPSPVSGSEAKRSEPQAPVSEVSDDLAAWVVQTGSFTAEGNARSLAEKLRKSNFPAFVEVVSNAGTSVYRVQVGPELSRTRAEQIQKQIENAVGIKGIVVPHP